MRTTRNGLLAIALTLAGVTGCQNKLHDDNVKYRQENQALREQNDELKTRPPERIIVERPAPPAPGPVAETTPPPAPAAPAQPAQPPIEDTQIGELDAEADQAAGTLTVQVPGDVLFDSGKAELRDTAKKTLDKVAASLKRDYAGKQVRVEGHTDSDPIKVSKWKSNLALSEARAKAVRDYLVKQGVEDAMAQTVGYGDTKPRATSKAANRRVEIVVLVRPGEAGAPAGGGATEAAAPPRSADAGADGNK